MSQRSALHPGMVKTELGPRAVARACGSMGIADAPLHEERRKARRRYDALRRDPSRTRRRPVARRTWPTAHRRVTAKLAGDGAVEAKSVGAERAAWRGVETARRGACSRAPDVIERIRYKNRA